MVFICNECIEICHAVMVDELIKRSIDGVRAELPPKFPRDPDPAVDEHTAVQPEVSLYY
jgi:hypothetical protein